MLFFANLGRTLVQAMACHLLQAFMFSHKLMLTLVFSHPLLNKPWWHHQMEICAASLAFCVGNSPVTGEFPSQRPVMRSFDIFFDLHLNKALCTQSRHRWFETPSCPFLCHCNVKWNLNQNAMFQKITFQNIVCNMAAIFSGLNMTNEKCSWIITKSLYRVTVTCRQVGGTQVNTLRPRQNGRHFPDDIFKCIFLNENIWISLMISLKFVPKVRINNILALVQIMAWRWPGTKSLSELIMVKVLTHICITRPQLVNTHRGLNKINEILKMLVSNAFWQCLNFKFHSIEMCFEVQFVSIGSGYGLLLIQQEAIIWTSVDSDLWCHKASLAHDELRPYNVSSWVFLAFKQNHGNKHVSLQEKKSRCYTLKVTKSAETSSFRKNTFVLLKDLPCFHVFTLLVFVVIIWVYNGYLLTVFWV